LRPYSDVGFGWVNEFMVTRTVRDTAALFDLLPNGSDLSSAAGAQARVGYWVHPVVRSGRVERGRRRRGGAAAMLGEWGATVSETGPGQLERSPSAVRRCSGAAAY